MPFAHDDVQISDTATTGRHLRAHVHDHIVVSDAVTFSATGDMAIADGGIVLLTGTSHGTSSDSGTLDVLPSRRDLTGDEQALLTLIATSVQLILMADFNTSATEATPAAILAYLVLRSALRCLERPFL